jgi:hypothetical protein
MPHLQLKQIAYLPVLTVLVTFISLNPYSTLPIGNLTVEWCICFITILCVLWLKRVFFNPSNIADYRIIKIYFLWMCICVIRGIFVAENYWEYKQLITGTLCSSLPVFVYVFSNPRILTKTLRLWILIALPAFIFFSRLIVWDSYQFYLSPLFLLGCFIAIMPNKWKIIVSGLLLVMLVSDLGARSQVIKSAVTIMVCAAFIFSRYITSGMVRLAHWMCYIVPVAILALAISGIFNPLQFFSEKTEGKYVQESKMRGKEGEEEDISADTRTLLYEEVIGSAVKHHYVILGRTPARGNDSWHFGAFNAEELKTGKYERHTNELCHTNIFTWLGLIGLILYGFIYLKSSYLAVFKSNNTMMKLLGVYIAFRWAFGWIEDENVFDIVNVALWMMIAMGFSENFRKMSDEDIKNWGLSIFKKTDV